MVLLLLVNTTLVIMADLQMLYGYNYERSRFFSAIRETRNDKSCFHYLCPRGAFLNLAQNLIFSQFFVVRLAHKFPIKKTYSGN